jgi:hypothetical protein
VDLRAGHRSDEGLATGDRNCRARGVAR